MVLKMVHPLDPHGGALVTCKNAGSKAWSTHGNAYACSLMA